MKKAKLSLVIVSIILLISSIYSITIDFSHFFRGAFAKISAAIIILIITYIYIDEIVNTIRSKKKLNLSRFNISILVLLISFCWIINQYLIELNTENIRQADSLFNLLATVLTLKIYILLKYILSDSEIKSIQTSIELDY